MASLRATRPAAGYYRLLDCVSTADFYENEDGIKETLEVSNSSTLPEGVYQVDRLISSRKQKVWQHDDYLTYYT